MPPPKVNIPMAESVSDDALTVDISAEAEQAPAAEMAAADAAAPTAAEPAAFPAAPARSVAQAAKKSDMVEKPLPGPVESMDRAHSELDEHVAGNSARREQVFAEAKEEQFSRTAAPPPAAAAPSAVQADAAELETVTVTGSRAKTRERTPEDRARDDLRLTPAAWIRKIRSRIANGDVATAKESLKYYAAKYPEEGVPKDLKDLLEEEP
jgi:hypothetical protein